MRSAALRREQRALPPGPRRLALVLEEHGVGTHPREAVLERGPGQRRHEHWRGARGNDQRVLHFDHRETRSVRKSAPLVTAWVSQRYEEKDRRGRFALLAPVDTHALD